MNLLTSPFGKRKTSSCAGFSLLFLVLASCGGGSGGGQSPPTFSIGGTVAGLNAGTNVVLLDNGGDATTVSADGAFSFATPLANAATFAVTVKTQPTGQTCTVGNGSGTVTSANVTNVAVVYSAAPTLYTIGGLVFGLTSGSQIALLNNGGDALTVTANGTFSFTTGVATAGAYAVTIATPPSGEACTVSTGSGTVAAANVSNVIVNCAATVAGSAILLQLGHIGSIGQIQMTSTRALSQDSIAHWNLWDLTTDSVIADGYSSCLSNACAVSLSKLGAVALAGGTVVIETAGALEICSASDGHVVATIPGYISWWTLASDGSYVAIGTPSALVAWSPTGKLLYSGTGDYSSAVAFAAPGQLLMANSPAGTDVIQTLDLTTGTASTGPSFQGQFSSWFADGSHYQTTVGNTVYTYLNTSAQADITSLTSVQGLAGTGNWFWAYNSAGTDINIYQVGSSAAPTATFTPGYDAQVTPSGSTLGIVPANATPEVIVVDLSGTTLTSATHPLPLSFFGSYAAASPSQWLVGNGYGVLFDGTSSASSPKYLTLGAARSIAGGGGLAAIATASGKIFVINPQTNVVQDTIDFAGTQLEMSTDGTVLAALSDSKLMYDPGAPFLEVYSIPSGTLTHSYGEPGSSYIVGYSLAGTGGLIAQSTSSVPSITATLQQVTNIADGSLIWSSTTEVDPVLFSPDGTFFAAPIGNPPDSMPTANIYSNGVLVGAIPALPLVWIDDTSLLANVFTGISSGCACFSYSGSTVYSSTGGTISSPPLPDLPSAQAVTPTSIYSPDKNAVYSLTSGAATWTGTPPIAPQGGNLGAIAGSYVVTLSGSQVVAEPY